MLSTSASIATLVLFVFYFIGRIITITATKRLWKDKVLILDDSERAPYNLVDEIYKEERSENEWLNENRYGVIVSKEGIRNLKIYDVKTGIDPTDIKKGELVYQKDFLNIDEAVAFYVPPGELFPRLFIEYLSFDFMKIELEWRDNLKSGVYSEFVRPKHTFRSFCYYLFR